MAPPNILPIHGNEKTMNMNPMILTNIQSSPYFKVKLYELKTYHEVVDEIFYKVIHLEPWEKGSRKTAGQTGMCGGVRGVGAGGIVSSAYCLLYKLFTLRLTRKQLNGLLTHADSCYIRALGFMYIRYTQPPGDFWEWFEPYLDDEEEIDVKAGGGHNVTIGEMLRTWLTKLEWYSTLFPRIPVPIQKSIETNLRQWEDERRTVPVENVQARRVVAGQGAEENGETFGEAERHSKLRESPVRNYAGRRGTPPFDIAGEMEKDRKHSSHKHRSRSRDRERRRSRSRERERKRSRERDRGHRSRSHERRRSRSRDRHERERRRSRSRERRRSRSRDRHERRRSKSRERRRHRSRSHDRHHRDRGRESSFERDLRREKDRHRNKHRDD